MKVLVAGASGVIGRPVVRALVAAGHEVSGTTRSEVRAKDVEADGARPIVCDALDADALSAAVVEAAPEVVVHELTALPRGSSTHARRGSTPLRAACVAMAPGTSSPRPGRRARGGWSPRASRWTGTFSYVHVDDAASATALAVERGAPGVYNVVDDEPAALREWLPVYAEALGAKRPLRVPAWLARLIAGPAAVSMATDLRGASNAKAKRELGWQLRYPSWRRGFAETR